MMKVRPLFFHHVPKTAGMSFRRLLLDIYGEARVSPMIPGLDVDEAVRTYRQCAVISGHMRAMPGDVLPPGYYTATVLREPVDRFLSEFYFSKYDVRANRAVLDEVKRLDLDEFLARSPDEADYTWNLQVETLYPYGCKEFGEVSPADKLKAAKLALELFDCVGIQEEFADFIHVVSYDLGWSVQAIPRENTTTRRRSPMEIPEELRQTLRERTALDAELYGHALSLFRRKRRRILLDCVASSHQAGERTDVARRDTSQVLGESISPEEHPNHHVAPIALGPVEFGDRRVEITGVTITGSLHDARAMFAGELMNIAIRIRAHEAFDNLTVGISIRDHQRRLAFGTNTRLLGYRLTVTAGCERTVAFTLRNDLQVGKYAIDATLHLGSSHLVRCFHWLESAAEFEIVGNIGDHFEGQTKLYPWVAVQSDNGDVPGLLRLYEADNEFLQRLDRPSPPLREFLAHVRPVSTLPTTFTAGDELAIELEIENTGTETWRAAGIRPVRIGFHWFDANGNWVDFEGIRTTLTHDVRPGEKALHWCALRVPEYCGPAILIWSLVQEEVAWFDDQQPESAFRLECEVAK